MVDFNKRICEGPSSSQKCAFCISKKLEGFNRNRILTRQIINNYFPSILKYKSLLNFTHKNFSSKNENNQSLLDFGNENYKKYCNPKLTNDVTERLKKNIDMLNLSSLIIGVSSDVRNKLIRYGVDEKLIKVQHIGSLIAEKKINHTKSLNKNKIVFGFIGGVGYYKGVHLIADAFNQLPDDLIKKCEVKIYGKGDENYVEAIKSKLFSNTHKNNFQFFGKYSPADIPEITNQIDISLLPSLCADTAPQTIFESYSAGLPVIGPKIGGFPDFISDGKNGFLFEAANSKSLSEKMLNILKNPHVIDNFKKHIPPLKTLDFNVQELNSIYEELKR
jgi:glycosyltransferase involved in cell wall biosynthesis